MRLYSVDKVLLGYVPDFPGSVMRFLRPFAVSLQAGPSPTMSEIQMETDWIARDYHNGMEVCRCGCEMDPYVIPGFVPFAHSELCEYSLVMPQDLSKDQEEFWNQYVEREIKHRLFGLLHPAITMSTKFDRITGQVVKTGRIAVGKINSDITK